MLADRTFTIVVVLAIALLFALLVFGCAATRTVGWDPSMNRCRAWDGERFTGPILKNAECAGMPRPEKLEE